MRTLKRQLDSKAVRNEVEVETYQKSRIEELIYEIEHLQ